MKDLLDFKIELSRAKDLRYVNYYMTRHKKVGPGVFTKNVSLDVTKTQVEVHVVMQFAPEVTSEKIDEVAFYLEREYGVSIANRDSRHKHLIVKYVE